MIKNLPAMQQTWVRSLGWEDPLEKRKWEPSSQNTGVGTPVFLTGESHGQRNLASYSPWNCKESDATNRLTLSLSFHTYIIHHILLFMLYIFRIIFYFNITFTTEQWEDEQWAVTLGIIKKHVTRTITPILGETCQKQDPLARQKSVGEAFKILPKETAMFYPYKDEQFPPFFFLSYRA